MLFYVRQKHQDLLTQLAVSIQNYLAIDIIIKNNIELIKGVDRASTTTISALRTAVIVAQALGNQKLVLDQITALNTTTSGDDRAHLARCSRTTPRAIQEQAASSSIGMPQLQAAFANIYATMDAIDKFKVQALDTMAATIGTLETEVEQVPRLPRPRAAAGPARWPRGSLDLGRHAPSGSALRSYRRDTWAWRLRWPAEASSRDSSGGGPSRERPSRLPARPDRAATCSPRWPGSRRWWPAGTVPAVVRSRVHRVDRTVRETLPAAATASAPAARRPTR